jgi:serine/threonine protein phosphatase PrpC
MLPADFFSGPGWAAFSLEGEKGKRRRLPNQDAVLITPSWMGDKHRLLAAVCDGHSKHGHDCAKQVLEALPCGLIQEGYGDHPSFALIAFCRKMDKQLEERFDKGGTTLVLADISPERMTIAHVGDSRASVVGSGELRHLTRDHDLHTLSPTEQEGIRRRGGVVIALGRSQPERYIVSVDLEEPSGLAIARSLGDREFGRGPSPIPEILHLTHRDIPSTTHLVLWTDGAWRSPCDALLPSTAVCQWFSSSSALQASLRMRDHMVETTVDDDATAVIIDLSFFRPSSHDGQHARSAL